MKTKTKPIDIRDEDPRMFMVALGNAVRSKGVSKVARELGLGRVSLYKIFLAAHHLSGTR